MTTGYLRGCPVSGQPCTFREAPDPCCPPRQHRSGALLSRRGRPVSPVWWEPTHQDRLPSGDLLRTARGIGTRWVRRRRGRAGRTCTSGHRGPAQLGTRDRDDLDPGLLEAGVVLHVALVGHRHPGRDREGVVAVVPCVRVLRSPGRGRCRSPAGRRSPDRPAAAADTNGSGSTDHGYVPSSPAGHHQRGQLLGDRRDTSPPRRDPPSCTRCRGRCRALLPRSARRGRCGRARAANAPAGERLDSRSAGALGRYRRRLCPVRGAERRHPRAIRRRGSRSAAPCL